MITLVRDLRYPFRAFAKNPLFTAAAVLSLALSGVAVGLADADRAGNTVFSEATTDTLENTLH